MSIYGTYVNECYNKDNIESLIESLNNELENFDTLVIDEKVDFEKIKKNIIEKIEEFIKKIKRIIDKIVVNIKSKKLQKNLDRIQKAKEIKIKRQINYVRNIQDINETFNDCLAISRKFDIIEDDGLGLGLKDISEDEIFQLSDEFYKKKTEFSNPDKTYNFNPGDDKKLKEFIKHEYNYFGSCVPGWFNVLSNKIKSEEKFSKNLEESNELKETTTYKLISQVVKVNIDIINFQIRLLLLAISNFETIYKSVEIVE